MTLDEYIALNDVPYRSWMLDDGDADILLDEAVDRLLQATTMRQIKDAPKDRYILLLYQGSEDAVRGWWKCKGIERPYWTNDTEAKWGEAMTRQSQPIGWWELPAIPGDPTP